MSNNSQQDTANSMVTFYHDIEQDLDNKADVSQCRRMVEEFLRIEKEHGIYATYNVVGKLYEEQSDLIEKILDGGHEIAFHSYQHPSDWGGRYYIDEVRRCREVSEKPVGYRSPRSQWNRGTLKALWENGFLWSAEADPQKEPYFIYKGLVRLPITEDDWSVHTGDISYAQWIERFAQRLQKKPYVAFGSHDFVAAGTPEQSLQAWEKVIQLARENKSLIVTFSEAADLFRRAACSKYYSEIAQDWNRDTRTLYRTRRFRELIRTEAEKMENPIIADLGSGGGALTDSLGDIAGKIYCVDNAPGMVTQADVKDGVVGRLGEVTDSGLPESSCDLVVCARVVEYLYEPDRLADEIKRIAKTGAEYFLTFPALAGKFPQNEGVPPDRIRRHYSPEQIQQWTEQIGTGHLIGIQYNPREPDNEAQEQDYRRQEENPHGDAIPTNWVYIGTVEQPFIPSSHRRHIPLSSFTFHFPLLFQPDPWAAVRKLVRFPIRTVRKFFRLFT